MSFKKQGEILTMRKIVAALFLTIFLVGGAAAQDDTSDLSGLEIQMLEIAGAIGDTFGTLADNMGTTGRAALAGMLVLIGGGIGRLISDSATVPAMGLSFILTAYTNLLPDIIIAAVIIIAGGMVVKKGMQVYRGGA